MHTSPRWVSVINDTIVKPENKGELGTLLYSVATVDAQHAPHVRTQSHRSFVAPKELPNLPLMLTTTTVRSSKVAQLLENPAVELAWFIEGSLYQFRITGRAFIVPSPDHALHADCASQMKRSFAATLMEQHGAESGPFTWENERIAAYKAAPARMRAKWAIPNPPGSVLSSVDELSKYPRTVPNLEDAETEEEKKWWHAGLANFALMIIEPTKVEWLQLKEYKLTVFTRNDEDEWEEKIVVP